MDYVLFDACLLQAYRNAETGYSFDDVRNIMHYFFDCYEHHRHQPHPPVRRQQLQRIIEGLAEVDDELGRPIEVFPDDYPPMIRLYFRARFKAPCDYRINHFMTNGVRLMRYYEHLCYDVEE